MPDSDVFEIKRSKLKTGIFAVFAAAEYDVTLVALAWLMSVVEDMMYRVWETRTRM